MAKNPIDGQFLPLIDVKLQNSLRETFFKMTAGIINSEKPSAGSAGVLS